MKKLNRKIAVRVFFFIIALDVVLTALDFLTSDSVWVVIPWGMVNLPGIPLFYFVILPLMPINPASLVCSMICVSVFSTVLWSVIVGYLLRVKHPA
jgi:hypothetical protein